MNACMLALLCRSWPHGPAQVLLVLPTVQSGVPLILSCVYIWSKNFGEGNVSLYGLVTIKAFYLPFAFLAMSVLMGDSYWPDLVGIIVGHIYYFFKDLYPISSGNHPLRTPNWLKRIVADWGLGRPPVAGPNAAAAAADPGFRAFYGRGMRLGTGEQQLHRD
jgi:Derlin-2/3